MILPVLSVRQPWAGLLVLGWKDVENRSRAILKRFVGRTVLIHAGLKLDDNFGPARGHMIDQAFSEALARGYKFTTEDYRSLGTNLGAYEQAFATGGIVGAVDVSDIVTDATSAWAEPGCVHTVVGNARQLPFFKCRGFQNVFNVDYPYDHTGASHADSTASCVL